MLKAMFKRTLLLVALAAGIAAPAPGEGEAKKLVQYGWDVQFPGYVAANIREMEKKPFDGIMMRTDRTSFSHVFYNRELDDEATKNYLKAMESIKWEKFTDSFFTLLVRSNMDWFSDEDWAPDGWVLRNVRLCAKAAKVGRCVGIWMDTESYWGRRPWTYAAQPHADEKSFVEFEKIVRKRGAQFMEALQEEFPDLVLLTSYLLANPTAYGEARKTTDAARRSEILKDDNEGLWPAFVNGMVDGIKGKAVIVDGHEKSYYHQELPEYTQAVARMREGAEGVKNLIDPKIWPKYQEYVQAGHGIYVDFYCNMLPLRTRSSALTDEEKARWVEHNVYYALKTSDKYAWIYSEYMNWWENSTVPPYLQDAIRSAKSKVAEGKPLGFKNDAPSRGWNELWSLRANPAKPKTARIQRLSGTPPRIDGKLNDPVWKKATPLGPFVAYLEAPIYELSSKTKAYAAYDRKNLYVAFGCREPDMKTMKEGHADLFDDVTVILAPLSDRTGWRAFNVNSRNEHQKFSEATAGSGGAGWVTDHQSAVYLGQKGWSVELVIPWQSLGQIPPKPGTELAANVAHMRFRHWGGAKPQYSTWSQFLGKEAKPSYVRVEPERLGIWVFE